VSLADQLLGLGSATLAESGAMACHPRIRAAWPGARLAAPALTVRLAPGDNLAVHVAVARAQPGAALVVEAGAPADRGFWGEVLTTAAQARQLAGLVIDGGVRDLQALEDHGFPVFCTLVALRGATKSGGGSVGARVEVGGVEVSPGDWVVGDRDGVVVVPSGSLEKVADRGRQRAEKEAAMFRALRAGATTLELLGLDASRVEQA
jgi:4-hydroxy-4-methyl-2-oxoglutarate aldolase